MGGTQRWLDVAARGDEDRFVQAFRELGLSEAEVEEDRRAYRTDVLPTIDAGGPLEQIRRRLTDILRRREYREEKMGTAVVSVPLFKLSSPKVTGTKVTYRETEADAVGGCWSVSIFGTGFGATTSLTIEYTSEFSSTNGGYSGIFVPVTLLVKEVAVYEKGRLRGRGLRAEVDTDHLQLEYDKGAQVLSAAELRRDVERAIPRGWFPLAEAPISPPSIYEKTWTSEESTDVRLGVAKFGLETTIKASVTRRASLTLRHELPGGHDYQSLRPANEPGVLWQVY